MDIIDEVGPKGTFLNKRHTVKNFKKELWFPTLLDRKNYGNWLKTGANGMEKRCRIRKEEILSKHKTEPLADDIKTDLEKVIENVKKNLTT